MICCMIFFPSFCDMCPCCYLKKIIYCNSYTKSPMKQLNKCLIKKNKKLNKWIPYGDYKKKKYQAEGWWYQLWPKEYKIKSHDIYSLSCYMSDLVNLWQSILYPHPYGKEFYYGMSCCNVAVFCQRILLLYCLAVSLLHFATKFCYGTVLL